MLWVGITIFCNVPFCNVTTVPFCDVPFFTTYYFVMLYHYVMYRHVMYLSVMYHLVMYHYVMNPFVTYRSVMCVGDTHIGAASIVRLTSISSSPSPRETYSSSLQVEA